jgi:hypothetical protein
MGNKNKFFVGIVVLICLIIIIFPKFTNMNGNVIEDKNEDYIQDQFSFNSEAHWSHMPLSYSITNCTEYQANRIIDAFNKIENETEKVVTFIKENKEEIDIEVTCYENYKESREELANAIDYTLGESGYWTYENTNIISKAEIDFYGITELTYSGGCLAYPDVEAHEILHAFGFGHLEGDGYIMNPLHTYCPSRLNDYITEKLEKDYSTK